MSGRGGRATLIAVAVVLAWLVIGGVAGPYAGRLSEVATNDNAAFLPTDAEATRAQDLAGEFVDRQTIPALVVYERPSGITDADRQRVSADAARFAQVPGVVAPLPPPIPSEDGQALQIVVPVDDAEGEEIGTVVEQLRDITGGDRDGLTVDVSGPAGLLADLIEVFSAIDGPLLLVTLVVVLVILLVVYRSPVLWIFPLLAAGMSYALASVVRLPARRRRRGQAQRAGPGHPHRAGLRRRHRLRAAADRPLPGGAAPPRPPLGRHAHRVEGRRAGHHRVRRHCHRQPALPAAVQPQLQPGARPGRRHRHRRHPAGDAHLPARAAGARRPLGVLAPTAPRGPGRPTRRARHLEPRRRLRGPARPPDLAEHRRRTGRADARPHPARRHHPRPVRPVHPAHRLGRRRRR